MLAKNFGVPEAAFANIPIDVEHDQYIFSAAVPGPLASDEVASPAGEVPRTFVHHLLDQDPVVAPGGTARIVDSSNFPVATTIAAAYVGIAPGGLRELHCERRRLAAVLVGLVAGVAAAAFLIFQARSYAPVLYKRPQSFRNLANVVEDEVVDALAPR